jgi:hypothetical protein
MCCVQARERVRGVLANVLQPQQQQQLGIGAYGLKLSMRAVAHSRVSGLDGSWPMSCSCSSSSSTFGFGNAVAATKESGVVSQCLNMHGL